MHSSFFLIFLTIFYLTFFVFIQSDKLSGELVDILDNWGYINLIALSTDKYHLQELKTMMENTNIPEETPNNNALLIPLGIIVGTLSFLMISTSLTIAYFNNINILTLLYTNLITIFFIGITDMFIVLFFSIFKVIQPGFLIGMTAITTMHRQGGTKPDCLRLVDDTLEGLFPLFKNLIYKQTHPT